MTEAQQKRFYFPLWREVQNANNWHMIKGRLMPEGARVETFGRAEADRLYQAVWIAAEALALENHRAVTADDLRHACSVVALNPPPPPLKGQGANHLIHDFHLPSVQSAKSVDSPISSKELTSKQLNRVAALFRVLIDPDNLDYIIAWDHPEKADAASIVAQLKKLADEPYINKIATDRFRRLFTPPFWEDLPLSQLKQLLWTVKNRVQQDRPKTANAPF